MQLTLLKGYPDMIGRRFSWAAVSSGSPSSYSPATGDPVSFPRYENYIDAIPTCMSVSGNYQVQFQPSAAGARATWTAFWFYSGKQGVSGISISTAGSGQTNGTYVINASGGGGTGAQVTIVVSGGAVTSAIVTNSGAGYTSAPTFTVAAGGTPGTLTATVAPASGAVANTTNLSAESVQVSGLGGQY